MTEHINAVERFLSPLYSSFYFGHTAFLFLLSLASQVLSQAAWGFYEALLLQEVLQDCFKELVWLRLDSRCLFLFLFPSHGRDAKEGDCDALWGNPRTREGESPSQSVSPNDKYSASHKPFSHHSEFFTDALSSISFCTLLLPTKSPCSKQ